MLMFVVLCYVMWCCGVVPCRVGAVLFRVVFVFVLYSVWVCLCACFVCLRVTAELEADPFQKAIKIAQLSL